MTSKPKASLFSSARPGDTFSLNLKKIKIKKIKLILTVELWDFVWYTPFLLNNY